MLFTVAEHFRVGNETRSFRKAYLISDADEVKRIWCLMISCYLHSTFVSSGEGLREACDDEWIKNAVMCGKRLKIWEDVEFSFLWTNLKKVFE